MKHQLAAAIMTSVAALAGRAAPAVPLSPTPPAELRIPVGEGESFRFVASGEAGRPICMELTARIHYEACSQYYALELALNGKRVPPFLGEDRTRTRLMNKPFFYTYTAGGEGCWFGENWVVYYGRDWEEARGIITASAEEPQDLHRYVVDISDLVRPGQTNVLQVRNVAFTVKRAFHGAPCPLVVKDLAVRHFDPEERRYSAAHEYPPAGTVVPRSFDRVEYACRLLTNGAVHVTCGGQRFLVESVYSYPGGIGNGFHAQEGLVPEPAWRAVADEGALSATGQGAFYRVERTLAPCPNHIAVTDRITNTGGDVLGMVIRNQVRVPPGTGEVYLCGNRNVTFAGRLGTDEEDGRDAPRQEFESGFSSYNPTFFVRSPSGGLGVAVFDDVMRMQCAAFRGPAAGGIRTDRFGLGPGQRYDVTWKIFPVPDGGYYEFINTIRAVEDLNVFEVDATAVGQWYMGRWEEERLEKWLDDRKLKYLIVPAIVPGLDTKTRHGPAFADHADKVVPEFSAFVRKVHKVRPGTEVLIYFSTLHFVDETNYMQRAGASLKIGRDGKPRRYANDYFTVHVDGKDAFSDELRKYIDFCLDTVGLDGIFWDVVACERERDIDYSRWDGHTVLLDDTYRVEQKVSLQGIEGIPFFVELIDRIHAKRKTLVLDYFSGARTVFAATKRYGVMGVMEGNNLGRNLVRTHLHTPLSMRGAEDPKDMDRCFQQVVWNIRNNLRHGNLYAFYGPWVDLKHSVSTDRIYPITPVELYPGYIIGRNKIVTTRSGRYGWPTGEARGMNVYVYSDQGERVPDPPQPRVADAGIFVDLDLPPDYLAVIERVKP